MFPLLQRASPAERAWLQGELRSNLAGEAGAVCIYRGALLGLQLRGGDAEGEAFAREHMLTEQSHLALFDRLLSPPERTVALPLWRASGFALGHAAPPA